MKRSVMILGFLLLMAIDTFVQIGFKMAGNNTLPMTLDWPWMQRVLSEPWLLGVLVGYCSSFLVYMTLIKYAPIGPAFAASHLEIVTVTLFSVYVFGDKVTLWQGLGCCAIIAGVVLLAATEEQS